jgi:transcriptional regulator with XRE-family HTH domain
MIDMRYDINKLERARRLKGWTKARLAQAIGLTAPAISAVWRGDSKNASTLKQIAEVLGLTVEDILIEDSQGEKAASTNEHGVERRRVAM